MTDRPVVLLRTAGRTGLIPADQVRRYLFEVDVTAEHDGRAVAGCVRLVADLPGLGPVDLELRQLFDLATGTSLDAARSELTLRLKSILKGDPTP